jgi:transposase
MSSHKSEDYKISAVEYYLTTDITQEDVCTIFKCSVRSLMRWVDKYETNGDIKRKNRKAIAYKIEKAHVRFILDEIKKNKTITMDKLLNQLERAYPNLSLSRVHLSRVVRDHDITLKVTRIRHEPTKRFGKDVDINVQLKQFYEDVRKHDIDDIICIDETCIRSLQKRHYCYSELGKRCVITTQSQEVFKRYTGIFAISTSGVIGWDLYEKGGINTERLVEFLEKNITSKFKNKLIILDNASSHRNEKIKELIKRNNTLLYSVPYQHFTNSIENYFSMLKSKMQKLEGLTYENIRNNIQHSINSIPSEKYKRIFKGSYNRDVLDRKKTSNRSRKKKEYKG